MHGKDMIKNNGGFSLVEVILALTILALVTLPIINYFTYSSLKTIDGRERQTATMAAEDVMDELKAYSDVEQIADMVGTPPPVPASTPSGDTYRIRVFYKYSYSVPADVSSVNPTLIKDNVNRVVCLDIQKGSEPLAGIATSTPTSTPVPSAGPTADPEQWQMDSAPLPSYTPDSNPLDITRKVVVNGSQYTAKVHFDFDTYDSGTKTVNGTNMDTKYNDYYVPSPNEVYGPTNVVATEDDEIDTAVSAIYTDLKARASSGNAYVAGDKISEEVTLEETEISKDMLKNIFIFYKPAWDSSNCEHFKVTAGSGLGFAKEDMEKINIYLTYQDLFVPDPDPTSDPAATPEPTPDPSSPPSAWNVSKDRGTYTLVLDSKSEAKNAIYANYYSNLNRRILDTDEVMDGSNNTIKTLDLPLSTWKFNGVSKYDSYVSKNEKRRIAKMYVDVFAVNETEFTNGNVLAHLESSYSE